MSRECAFCPETAKLSGEHIWSAWMEELIPGKKVFTTRNEKEEIVSQRMARGLDWTAKVVCKRCNEAWMSEIENKHAKPAMSDLILGRPTAISHSRAHSLAVFAFKTAVVTDHRQRKREPFFVRATRYRFRESLTVPPRLGIWLASFLRFRAPLRLARYPPLQPDETVALPPEVAAVDDGSFSSVPEP